jgi:hypothetical protein
MSRGPENRFIASIHRLLKGLCHFEKMHNPYRGGTADVWYSGFTQDAWVEYKWLPRVPKRGVVKPKLEPLQREWLRGRFLEGRTVFVVIGCPAGGIVFPLLKDWEEGVLVSQIRIMPKKELANEIYTLVGRSSETKNEESVTKHSSNGEAVDVDLPNNSSRISAVRVSKLSTKEIKCARSRRTTRPASKAGRST